MDLGSAPNSATNPYRIPTNASPPAALNFLISKKRLRKMTVRFHSCATLTLQHWLSQILRLCPDAAGGQCLDHGGMAPREAQGTWLYLSMYLPFPGVLQV